MLVCMVPERRNGNVSNLSWFNSIYDPVSPLPVGMVEINNDFRVTDALWICFYGCRRIL